MTRTLAPEFLQAFDTIPNGTSVGHSRGRRYVATKSCFNDGKSVKLVAEELGGTDYISCNLYLLTRGARLFPCEMPVENVIHFVMNFNAEQP